jgi:hypothetical protein
VNSETKTTPARNDVSGETGESVRIENADRKKPEEVRSAKRKKLEIGKQAEG